MARPFIARWRGAPRALRPPWRRGGGGGRRGRCGGCSRSPWRCAVAGARRRGCSGPAGLGLPAAPGAGAELSSFPCPAESFPSAAGAVPAVPVLPGPVPRACGERCERDGARGAFPQPLCPQTALCPPRSPPGSGEQPSGKFFQGRPPVGFFSNPPESFGG